jgi:hypothetical protein
MLRKLAQKIDEVSELLEKKGHLEECKQLDIIANTLEKNAYLAKSRPPYKENLPLVHKGVTHLLERIEVGNDRKIKSITKLILDNLGPVKEEFERLKLGIFKDGKDDYTEDCISYLDNLEKNIVGRKVPELKKFVGTGFNNFIKEWTDNEQRIHDTQMKHLQIPPGGKPF